MPAQGRVWSPVAFYSDPIKTPRAKVHTATRWIVSSAVDTVSDHEESGMSKGMDQKKSEKKKPAKTMKEKKSEKKDKKANKAFAPN